jgi:hypothetical protein
MICQGCGGAPFKGFGLWRCDSCHGVYKVDQSGMQITCLRCTVCGAVYELDGANENKAFYEHVDDHAYTTVKYTTLDGFDLSKTWDTTNLAARRLESSRIPLPAPTVDLSPDRMLPDDPDA